ncbi:MAG: glycosyltransferase family 39 protein [Chloroflexi bacterium]|nr:glycosyltransferase family 39 protein [Chloroflexota bacterium]
MTHAGGVTAWPTGRVGAATWLRVAVVPMGLFLIALVVRVLVAQGVVYPLSEDAAYYGHVASRLASGDGLTSLALWSYSTPPLTLPRPAFEIWMPLSSLVAAPFRAILGDTHQAAQWSSILIGACVAPLTWLVARDAARALRLPTERRVAVTIGSGLVAAVLGPMVVAASDAESTTVFLVFGTLSALLMARTFEHTGARWGLLLGVALGLAYLARQEAIWLGLAYLVMLGGAARKDRLVGASIVRRLVPVIIGGLVVVTPWLLRQWLAFGTPFPGQALENAIHIRNEDIFAYAVRPTLERFLDQGLAAIIEQRLFAAAYQLGSTLIVLPFPVGLLGLVGVVALRRSGAFQPTGSLFALMCFGVLMFSATALMFPVATLWGTFLHSVGPLLVGCTVTTLLLLDALVARAAAWRRWRPTSAWLGPLLVMGLVIPTSVTWVSIEMAHSKEVRTRSIAVASVIERAAVAIPDDEAPGERASVITNYGIYAAAESGRPTLSLPDESPEDVTALARRFGVSLLVVVGQRGRYPDALLTEPRHPCLAADPERVDTPGDTIWMFHLASSCTVVP